jgi:L,D-transpeptidase catalytic domain
MEAAEARRALVGAWATLVAVAASVHLGSGRGLWHPYVVAMTGGPTHAQVLARLGPVHRPRLRAAAARLGAPYPPERVRLVGLKREKRLEVWIPRGRGWARLRSYRVLAASGGPGPKRREGDLQVPEGIYRLTRFNPNSRYHLSVRVDYPNRDDRAAAAAEGRTGLGGDIFIHGKAASIGCLAIGDRAIEELYLLLADTGLGSSGLILSPSAEPDAPDGAPAWVGQLYERIRAELRGVRGGSAGPS